MRNKVIMLLLEGKTLIENNYELRNQCSLSHFFVMLFLIGSKWIFNLVNAFLFVLLILSIYHLTSHKKACNSLLGGAT